MDSLDKYLEISNYIDESLLYNTITESMATSLYDEAFNKYIMEDGENNTSQPIVISLDNKLQQQKKSIIALLALCVALTIIVTKIIKDAEKDSKSKGKLDKLKSIINFLTRNKLALKELKAKNAELCKKGHALKAKYDATKEENEKLKNTNEKLKSKIKAMQAEQDKAKDLANKVSNYNNGKHKAEGIKTDAKNRKTKGTISKEEYQESIKVYNDIQNKLNSAKSDIMKTANELKNSNSEYSSSIGTAISKCISNMK